LTTQQLETIAALRRENYSYQFIGDHLGIPMNTVKSICRRRGMEAEQPRKTKADKQNARFCRNCNKPLLSSSRSDAAFCSDYCRVKWRRKNRRIIEK